MIIRHSMIEDYLQCPNKFYELHVIKNVVSQSKSALSYGSAVHAALQSAFDGDSPYDTFNMYWNSVRDEKLEYDRYSWEDYQLMTTEKFLPNFMSRHFKKFDGLQTEMKLETPILGEHVLQGTLDWVGNYNGVLTLGDWKTSGSRYYPSKIQRSLQMYIYAYLYQKTTGILPKALQYYVFVKSDRSIQSNIRIDLTQELLASRMSIVACIIKDIIQKVDAKDTTKWYPNPGCFCINPAKCFPGG